MSLQVRELAKGLTDAINQADLSVYKDFNKASTMRQVSDDYELCSVVKDKNHKSETTGRSKSSKPLGPPGSYSESEVRYKKRNYFGEVKDGGVKIEALGFGRDFLEYEGTNKTKNDLLTSDKNYGDMDVSKRYEKVDFSKLDDLDFHTNRATQALITDLRNEMGKLNVINEVNENDFDTPQYKGGVLQNQPKKKQVAEESLLDL